ncbi:Uncharacterized protein FWK35_00005334 [Aphis craccivora]|uniref:Uncharacterized protein n=1 Tax=Aphis craccivora TaxID=307492 RepID=A0A6G0Z6E4_APHCR|nr:Uncharacterized protein FWK35_00005334 [Aphis craccivora]
MAKNYKICKTEKIMTMWPFRKSSRHIYNLKKHFPSQCIDCQFSFNHTCKNYCHHIFCCVKCSENHFSNNCTKPISDPAKYALFSGLHTEPHIKIHLHLKSHHFNFSHSLSRHTTKR